MHSFLQFLRDDNPGSSEDNMDFTPSDDLKYELGMLLSSRPSYLETDELPLVNGSVLNYGIKPSIYTAVEHSDIVNGDLSSRLLIMLQRYEPRLKNPIIDHLFSDCNYSHFSITALFFMDKVKFRIKWNKNSGEISLDE